MVQLAKPLLALLTIAFLAVNGAVAAPRDPPLPPHRPPELGSVPERPSPPALAPAPAPSVAPAPAPAPVAEQPRTCTARLQALGYDLKPAPPPAAHQAACHIDEPVALASIRVGEAPPIRIEGGPVVDCRLAEAVGEWVSRIADPVLSRAMGARLIALRDVGGFECRNRNRRPDGKMSAHAQGLAIDIGAFEFANGSLLRVKDPGPLGADAFAALRHAACGWFLTVLGPGSDASHASHLHLDLQLHGSSDRYRICQ
jgi:hypothetical protein